MRILAFADQVEPQLYSNNVVKWLGPVDLLISCGDLPAYYIEFLFSTFNVPVMHVLGNHCYVAHDPVTKKCSPSAYPGVINLNGRVVEHDGLSIAGAEGSPFYNNGPHQYTEQAFTVTLLRLVPFLLANKVRTGRYLDIMVTHAPPRGIHDNADVAHRGFVSLRTFIERFHPTLLLHGHTHRYEPMMPIYTDLGRTTVINTYGHVLLDLEPAVGRAGWQLQTEQLRGVKKWLTTTTQT
jgi:uncharacterized protein